MKIKKFLISRGVEIVTISDKANRCTIGYRRINRMTQVAVSYCAPDDKWSKQTGRDIVVNRLRGAVYSGDCHRGVISLPIGNVWLEEDIQSTLIDMFFYFDTRG